MVEKATDEDGGEHAIWFDFHALKNNDNMQTGENNSSVLHNKLVSYLILTSKAPMAISWMN